MRFYYLLSVLCIFNISIGFSQTSVQDGNWTDPTTWDCNCVPLPYLPTSIDVTVDHVVTADIFDPLFSLNGRTYFDGGSLTIGPNGTLLQMGEGDLFMEGATTLVNGILDMRRVAIENGPSTIYNGIIQNCDSLWNDSCNVINNGVITTFDHQVFPNGSMTNNGTINMTNKMNIQGEYTNTLTGELNIAVDFSNMNVFGGRALLTNNGSLTIMNNFINTTNDTIMGTGTICIGNLSTNQGTVLGTLTITTPTGGFSVNTGFVAPPVVFNVGNCGASINESDLQNISIFPNPNNGIFTLDSEYITSFEIVGVDGKIIKSFEPSLEETTVDISNEAKGIYLIKINSSTQSIVRRIILD